MGKCVHTCSAKISLAALWQNVANVYRKNAYSSVLHDSVRWLGGAAEATNVNDGTLDAQA